MHVSVAGSLVCNIIDIFLIVMSKNFGSVAAAASVCFSLMYGVPQIAVAAGAFPKHWDNVILFVPSIFLAVAYIALAAAIADASMRIEKGAWGFACLGTASVYTTLVSVTYFVSLTLVIPQQLRGNVDADLVPFIAKHPSFLESIDALGYGFLSASTWFGSYALAPSPYRRAASWFMAGNGLIGIAVVLVWAVPSLLAIGALWLITFPGSALFLLLHFRTKRSQT
jgi:hypothetical protein